MIDILIGAVVVLSWNGYLFIKMKQDEGTNTDCSSPSGPQLLFGVSPDEDEERPQSDDYTNV